jgi:hypothetical protein
LEGYQLNQLQMNACVEEMGYGRHPSQTQGDGLYQQLDCEPTLQIGYASFSLLNYSSWLTLVSTSVANIFFTRSEKHS